VTAAAYLYVTVSAVVQVTLAADLSELCVLKACSAQEENASGCVYSDNLATILSPAEISLFSASCYHYSGKQVLLVRF